MWRRDYRVSTNQPLETEAVFFALIQQKLIIFVFIIHTSNHGMLWWIIDDKKPIYAAIGNSGNVIYVDEQEKMTVAIASHFKSSVLNRIDFIEQTLLKTLI